jgi:uridine kinase
VDLRPDQTLCRDQRGLPKLSGFVTRLDRRPGEAAHYPAPFLDALAERLAVLKPRARAAMIAIDGWGCGGKTALAEGLLDRLEPAMQCLSLDSFFAGFGQDQPDSPVPHLRWNDIREAIGALAEHGRTAVRDYDWDAAKILPPQALEGRAWLVEGLYSLRSDLRPWYDFTIWVEGRLERRLDRVAARDGAHMIPFWESDWMPSERAYIVSEQPWRSADLIVVGAELGFSDLGRQLREHAQ